MPGAPQFKQNDESARDPVCSMAEILRDEHLDQTDKEFLYQMSNNRFKHRRRIAYIALFGIFATAGASAVPQVTIDGISWLYAFFAGIVGAYYGISGFRPNS